MKWLTVTLKEISTRIQYGYTASAVEEEVGPKFLRITDIVEPQINWDTVPYCQIDELDIEKYRLNIGWCPRNCDLYIPYIPY